MLFERSYMLILDYRLVSWFDVDDCFYLFIEPVTDENDSQSAENKMIDKLATKEEMQKK